MREGGPSASRSQRMARSSSPTMWEIRSGAWLPQTRKQPNKAMDRVAAPFILMYVVLPMWLAAGFADYLCHRAARIETTSGWKESALHLLQFAEMAVPTLAAIFLEINALIFLIMIIAIILHHATAI